MANNINNLNKIIWRPASKRECCSTVSYTHKNYVKQSIRIHPTEAVCTRVNVLSQTQWHIALCVFVDNKFSKMLNSMYNINVYQQSQIHIIILSISAHFCGTVNFIYTCNPYIYMRMFIVSIYMRSLKNVFPFPTESENKSPNKM